MSFKKLGTAQLATGLDDRHGSQNHPFSLHLDSIRGRQAPRATHAYLSMVERVSRPVSDELAATSVHPLYLRGWNQDQLDSERLKNGRLNPTLNTIRLHVQGSMSESACYRQLRSFKLRGLLAQHRRIHSAPDLPRCLSI